MNLLTIADFIHGYEGILETVAQFIIITLELIGIIVIVFGAGKAIFYYFKKHFKKNNHNIRIDLGRTLALSLEFKMGAEIIKTVIVHELSELAVLGVIIILRAALAFLIHWEIKNEEKEQELHDAQKAKEQGK